jgi:predicted dehydrogenase
MDGTVQIALVGAGMFGGDVHARAYADLYSAGISGNLSRVGLERWARELAPLRFNLVAVATRSEASARKLQEKFKAWTG